MGGIVVLQLPSGILLLTAAVLFMHFPHPGLTLYLFRRQIFHTVGPQYAAKYHTAAENALSSCYRTCLEVLVEMELHR